MLKELIKAEIERRGFLTFDRFVNLALYHPQYGYYTKRRTKPISGEDFFTAPELSPLFGKAVANHIKRIFESKNIPLRIVELGGGKGFLAKDIISSLPVEDYTIVEKSDVAKELVPTVNVVKSLDELENLTGFIISNEFFDAFPFKRIKNVDGELYEVVIQLKDNQLTENLIPFNGKTPCKPERGCEYSLFIGWDSFLEALFRKFQKGYFLTADYGNYCNGLTNREDGTFLAFRKNRVEENYLNVVGEVDLTSRVDFSHLGKLLEKYLENVEVKPQSKFLLSEGIEKFSSPKDTVAAITLLVDMGRKFKVLSGYKVNQST